MILKKYIILSLFTTTLLMAQSYPKKGTIIQLTSTFLGKHFNLSDTLFFKNNSITIENYKLYLSRISLLKNGKQIWEEENSFHLVDLSKSSTLKIQLNTPAAIQFDEIQFHIGIDSVTNVSGAIGGDLDPTNGMYWSWQSGYINFKLEGYCTTCPTRNHFYEFHLGGYLSPFQSEQTVNFKINSASTIHLGMDIGIFLNQLDLSKQCAIMSPGIEAKRLSKLVSSIFYIIPYEK